MSNDEKIKSASGATSSGKRPAFHLIPNSTLIRLADRYALGIEKHGDINYQKCIRLENIHWEGHDYQVVAVDVRFVRDRFDHCITHILNIKWDNDRDDNIGAALWGLSMLSWLEKECQLDVQRLLHPRLNNEIWYFLHPGTKQAWVMDADKALFKEPTEI